MVKPTIVLGILVFAAVGSLGLGIAAALSRSKLRERFEKISRTSQRERYSALKNTGGTLLALARRLGWNFDLNAFDRLLYLAGRPFNLTAEEFVGGWALVAAFVSVIAFTACFSGAAPKEAFPLCVGAAVILPFVQIRTLAEEGRAVMGSEVVKLCQQMELGTSAGLDTVRVLEWVVEGTGMLAGVLKVMLKEMVMGQRTYALFSKLADDYGVPEAREIAVSLKQAEVQGLPIAQTLVELSRDLRNRREYETDMRVTRVKPTVEVYLTAACMIAAFTLMLGPLVADNFKELSVMLSNY